MTKSQVFSAALLALGSLLTGYGLSLAGDKAPDAPVAPVTVTCPECPACEPAEAVEPAEALPADAAAPVAEPVPS